MEKFFETSNLAEEGFVRRVAVVRALRGLGDLLCAVPALRALRAAFPRASITLVGLPAARPFVERFRGYVDDLLELPGYPGLPEVAPQPLQLTAFLAEAQKREFDLAIQMHGSGTVTNPLTVLLGAKYNAGFYLPGQYCPDEQRFLAYPSEEPEIWRNLRLLEFLGIPLQGDYLEFPLTEEDFRALGEVEETRLFQNGPYVCLHPGANAPARRWGVERFAAVGDALAGQGLRIVLTGTPDEVELAQAVARAMKAPALNLAGRTGLGALAALLRGARLLVCNDTGVSHLAAALQLPSVVIFTSAEPHRWAPLNRQRHRVVRHKVECSPCQYSECPIDHRCATGLTPQLVLAQARQLLRKEKVYAA